MHSDYRALHRAEYTWHLLYQTILWNKYNDKQLRHSERANSWSTAPHCCLPSVVLDLFQHFIGLKWILSVKTHAGRVYTAYHVSRIDLVAPRPRSILSTWYAVYTCPLCILTNLKNNSWPEKERFFWHSAAYYVSLTECLKNHSRASCALERFFST